MNDVFRRIIASSLCVQLTFLGTALQGCAASQATTAHSVNEFLTSTQSNEPTRLRQVLQKPSVELFDLVPTLQFTANEIQFQRKALEKGEDFCVARFKDHAKRYAKQIAAAQKDLKVETVSLNEGQRQRVHCLIQNLELLRSEAQALSSHAIPTAYDNLNAKLDLSRGPNEHFFEPRLASPSEDDQVNLVHFRAVHNVFDRVSNSDIRFQVNVSSTWPGAHFADLFPLLVRPAEPKAGPQVSFLATHASADSFIRRQ